MPFYDKHGNVKDDPMYYTGPRINYVQSWFAMEWILLIGKLAGVVLSAVAFVVLLGLGAISPTAQVAGIYAIMVGAPALVVALVLVILRRLFVPKKVRPVTWEHRRVARERESYMAPGDFDPTP